MRCIWRSNLHQVIKDTKCLADLAYINTYYPTKFITGKKKPRNRTLSASDITYNQKIAKQRGNFY